MGNSWGLAEVQATPRCAGGKQGIEGQTGLGAAQAHVYRLAGPSGATGARHEKTDDQGARALAHPPAGPRVRGCGGKVAARGIRQHRLKRELARDSLRVPSWSTPAHGRLSARSLWTLQSLAGVDHCEALAAATNNNLVGAPRGAHELQNGALTGAAARTKTTPLLRLAVGAAPPPPFHARCVGCSRQRTSSRKLGSEHGCDYAALDKDRHGRGDRLPLSLPVRAAPGAEAPR